ncbi:MAG: glycosyl hydrolase [Bacteroides thetaiotaomicron]
MVASDACRAENRYRTLIIEIGIFNSPGWSQSGGPWVKPE